MKRLLSLLLLLLLFVGCQKVYATDVTFEDLERVICENANTSSEFTKADEDFITTNFPFTADTENSAVYLKNEAGILAEYGIFRLKEHADKSAVVESIRAYLLAECDAMRALAALYPGNTLSENLKRYENAMISASGNYVWYFATDQKIASAANDAIKDSLTMKKKG